MNMRIRPGLAGLLLLRLAVGVRIDKAGGLLVADDVGNAIWCVTPTGVGRS